MTFEVGEEVKVRLRRQPWEMGPGGDHNKIFNVQNWATIGPNNSQKSHQNVAKNSMNEPSASLDNYDEAWLRC